MKRLIDSAEKVDLKGKVGTAFGSYGMKVIEPGLRWKPIPDEEGLKKCREFKTYILH